MKIVIFCVAVACWIAFRGLPKDPVEALFVIAGAVWMGYSALDVSNLQEVQKQAAEAPLDHKTIIENVSSSATISLEVEKSQNPIGIGMRIVGNLDGVATFKIMDMPSFELTGSFDTRRSGRVNGAKAELIYTPSKSVANGVVNLEYGFVYKS